MEFLEALFEWVGTLLDANADGVVDLADAASGAGSAVAAVSNFADADGSGIINFEDAKSLLFNYIDQNGSGTIESEDFQQIMLAFFDKDANGQINHIDMQLRKLATEIGEHFGPAAKVAFNSSLKALV